MEIFYKIKFRCYQDYLKSKFIKLIISYIIDHSYIYSLAYELIGRKRIINNLTSTKNKDFS